MKGNKEKQNKTKQIPSLATFYFLNVIYLSLNIIIELIKWHFLCFHFRKPNCLGCGTVDNVIDWYVSRDQKVEEFMEDLAKDSTLQLTKPSIRCPDKGIGIYMQGEPHPRPLSSHSPCHTFVSSFLYKCVYLL